MKIRIFKIRCIFCKHQENFCDAEKCKFLKLAAMQKNASF